MNISKKTMLTIVIFVTALIAESAMKTIYNYLYDINDIIEPKNTSSYDVTEESGITPAELQYRCGDMYEISQIEYEYSGQPAGTVSSVSIQSGKTEGYKIPLKMTLSLGNDPFENDYFKNLTVTNAIYASGLEDYQLANVISSNNFPMPDGSMCHVMILKKDSNIPYMEIFRDGERETISCCKNMKNAKGYNFDGNFTLSLEDYNCDGKPDFIYKAAPPDKHGCTYRIHFTDTVSDDPVIYIYDETSDSPRLDRIDRSTFFYFTKKNEYPTPIVLNANGETLDRKDYENNGWVFTSYYENGTISLKGTAAYTTARLTNEAEIAVKKLDELVWRDINVPQFNTEFSVNRAFESDTATIAKELEQGVYKIEVTINGKTTSTEFYVY